MVYFLITATYLDCKANYAGSCFLLNNNNGKITKLNVCTFADENNQNYRYLEQKAMLEKILSCQTCTRTNVQIYNK